MVIIKGIAIYMAIVNFVMLYAGINGKEKIWLQLLTYYIPQLIMIIYILRK